MGTDRIEHLTSASQAVIDENESQNIDTSKSNSHNSLRLRVPKEGAAPKPERITREKVSLIGKIAGVVAATAVVAFGAVKAKNTWDNYQDSVKKDHIEGKIQGWRLSESVDVHNISVGKPIVVKVSRLGDPSCIWGFEYGESADKAPELIQRVNDAGSAETATLVYETPAEVAQAVGQFCINAHPFDNK